MAFAKRLTSGNQMREILLQRALLRKQELQKQTVASFGEWLPQATPNYTWDWTHLRYVQRYMDKVTNREIQNLMVFLPPRHGKMLSHKELVLTANRGWTTHGDLKVGDFVFHPTGIPVEVVALSDDDVVDHQLVTQTGDIFTCHANHEWTVYDRGSRKFRTFETHELANRQLIDEHKGKRRSRYQLPLVAPLQFPAQILRIEPYVLGAWLGDGRSIRGEICYAKTDHAVVDFVGKFYKKKQLNEHATTGVMYQNFSLLLDDIRALGLYNNKHIPEIYLRSSLDQRLQLLAGLIDTDGSIEPKTGRVRFTTVSKRLADDVYDLTTTLGFRPYLSEVQPVLSSRGIQGRQVVFVVGFQPTMEIPCQLERKKIKRFAPQRMIGIAEVRKAAVVEMGRCITVDAPDGLYLVGKNLIPTHNSEQITVRYPPYMLERDPASRLVITSATATLAEKFSRKSRAIVRARSLVDLDKERQSVKDWRTTAGGGLRAIGVGGSIVGEGFDMLLLDDPVASREEVESLTYRDKLWEWYKDDLYTRREPGAGMVLQVTRWHEDDLAGRLLESNLIGTEEEWIVISLPALCEGNDPPDYPHREVGEALCPARRDRDSLLLAQRTMGSSFDALYQQRPAPEEGDIFKKDWFQRHVNNFPVRTAKLTQVWDTAFEKGQRNDFAALVEGYRDVSTGLIFVAAMENEKMEFPELVRAMRAHRDRIGPNSDTCVENKATGKPARQQLRTNGVPIIEIDPGTSDKVARAKSITSYCESQMVVFVDLPGNKNKELLDQLLVFPNGKHDDLVDAFVHFMRRVTTGAQRWDKKTLAKFNTALRPGGTNYD